MRFPERQLSLHDWTLITPEGHHSLTNWKLPTAIGQNIGKTIRYAKLFYAKSNRYITNSSEKSDIGSLNSKGSYLYHPGFNLKHNWKHTLTTTQQTSKLSISRSTYNSASSTFHTFSAQHHKRPKKERCQRGEKARVRHRYPRPCNAHSQYRGGKKLRAEGGDISHYANKRPGGSTGSRAPLQLFLRTRARERRVQQRQLAFPMAQLLPPTTYPRLEFISGD